MIPTDQKQPEDRISYQAMRKMTPAECLALRCMQPLLEFSDAGGWVNPQDIGKLQAIVVAYLESLPRD